MDVENIIDIEEINERATVSDVIEYLKTLDQNAYMFLGDSEYPGDYLTKDGLSEIIKRDEDIIEDGYVIY